MARSDGFDAKNHHACADSGASGRHYALYRSKGVEGSSTFRWRAAAATEAICGVFADAQTRGHAGHTVSLFQRRVCARVSYGRKSHAKFMGSFDEEIRVQASQDERRQNWLAGYRQAGCGLGT